MRIVLFGATGMVGQGVLRECLLDSSIKEVITVGRNSIPQQSPKLRQIVRNDLFDLSGLDTELAAVDACFFCLGVSSAGMDEAQYTRLTYDLTLAAAQVLARLNPQMTFVYVSGAGTDSTEQGRSMWARVKGRTENALQRLPFKAAYLLRPGVIQPLHGARSKTMSYRVTYTLAKPLLPLVARTVSTPSADHRVCRTSDASRDQARCAQDRTGSRRYSCGGQRSSGSWIRA